MIIAAMRTFTFAAFLPILRCATSFRYAAYALPMIFLRFRRLRRLRCLMTLCYQRRHYLPMFFSSG